MASQRMGEDYARTWRSLTVPKRFHDNRTPTHVLHSVVPRRSVIVCEDSGLLDLAPFTLGVKPDLLNVSKTYDVGDAYIKVAGISGIGIATVHDYSIFLYMCSHLENEVNRIRRFIALRAGRGGRVDPALPARVFKPETAGVLKFTQRKSSGAQYRNLMSALRRLKLTTIFIETKESFGSTSPIPRRRAGSFSLISDYRFITLGRTGNPLSVEIDIPHWVYQGIVRNEISTTTPLGNNYFSITDGITRVLYRICIRNVSATAPYQISLQELHYRSGSLSQFKYFKRDLLRRIKDSKKIIGERFIVEEYGIERGVKGVLTITAR